MHVGIGATPLSLCFSLSVSLFLLSAWDDSWLPRERADRSAALAIVGDLRQQALSRATAGANRQAEARKVADLARTQQTSAAAAATSGFEAVVRVVCVFGMFLPFVFAPGSTGGDV